MTDCPICNGLQRFMPQGGSKQTDVMDCPRCGTDTKGEVVGAAERDELRAEVERLREYEREYVCPNGHAFPDAVAVRCGECDATVVCEPASRGMALHAEIERLCSGLPAEVERLRGKVDDSLAAAERATDLAERYGAAILAIGDALPDIGQVRRIIATLNAP